MLWEVDIHRSPGQPEPLAARVVGEAKELGIAGSWRVVAVHGYLVEGDLTEDSIGRAARELLADGIVELPTWGIPGENPLNDSPEGWQRLIHVLPKPGVMDPVAQSALATLQGMGLRATGVRTLRKYWFDGDLPESHLQLLRSKVLANDAIEQIVPGPLRIAQLEHGAPYEFRRVDVPLRDLADDALVALSREGQLSLSLVEMQAIRDFFRDQGRDPTDVELETLAQTWSEHCSHKTLAGPIRYRDEQGTREFGNMLRETIFAATEKIRAELGSRDWCVSVFADNAGVVRFDDRYHVSFKVETHNHPSAIEPYGGANTGLGGVIRDTLGTGLGAKPVCSTDVFCFAPPEIALADLPPGVLHPRRVLRGVVSGVRDYGNRMGIPTVNGAVCFDERYLGNPLVFCGNVGLLPHDRLHKEPQAGDLIVVVGGRTGRDGIHGATFSSIELTSQSEDLSGGAVQIGNAITEKMVTDVLLEARDRGLFHAVTDCGAGGLSSAVGEMGAELGANVWLEKVPLKYAGLSYAEVWISEAQERMVLAVSAEHWQELAALCASEGVEATHIGRFEATGRLRLEFDGRQVADLDMQFLHRGCPRVTREAVYERPTAVELSHLARPDNNYNHDLLQILASPNVASKEWIIRQYDHEVQGGSAIKPLVGVREDSPGDAAVVRPVLDSRRGVAIACGINPRYGDLDAYDMAASAADEAVRNCVAVGADPNQIAVLDNFCWGDCNRPEMLGSLVRAALGAAETAVGLRTPFISGKDSLNNEFRYTGKDGVRESIAIPATLLVSAMGHVANIEQCISMDFKQGGSAIYQVGATHDEVGGSHLSLVRGAAGGRPPAVDAQLARRTFLAVHRAIVEGLVLACHDMSEGGLAAAAAEMVFAGELGARIGLEQVPRADELARLTPAELVVRLLFAESNSRFLCEVPHDQCAAFEAAMAGVPRGRIGRVSGEVSNEPQLEIFTTTAGAAGDRAETPLIGLPVSRLKQAWQQGIAW